MNYKHTEHYVEKIISYANLTRNDVMVHFRQKGMAQRSYRDAINYLRKCDADTIRWILSTGKYLQ